jgi:hypothetical protein
VIGDIPTDTLIQAERWNRIAVQMRPDGRVSAIVGDSILAVHPFLAKNDSTTRWRALVIGASLDNVLYVRELTLWREERIR